MEIIISNSSGVPIYEQIQEQLKVQIVSGELKENESLPSIRTLAKDLRCSVITTKNAYEELVKEGYIVNVPSKGFYVAKINQEVVREELLARRSANSFPHRMAIWSFRSKKSIFAPDTP